MHAALRCVSRARIGGMIAVALVALVVGLLFVVGQHALYPSLVPPSRISRLCHEFFRLRRSAFNAFGPSS